MIVTFGLFPVQHAILWKQIHVCLSQLTWGKGGNTSFDKGKGKYHLCE